MEETNYEGKCAADKKIQKFLIMQCIIVITAQLTVRKFLLFRGAVITHFRFFFLIL